VTLWLLKAQLPYICTMRCSRSKYLWKKMKKSI